MAYRKGHDFHGVHYRTPSTYSYVESNMRVNKTNGAKAMAILGESKGGVPGAITLIEDPETARKVLKGGDLLDACMKAYDPVIETKEGVELGGADVIFAIRTNKATRAETSIYQDKTVEATVGEVVKTVHPSTNGKVSVSGEYTGKENKTFKIEITSDGTVPLAEATYRYSLAKDDVTIEDELKLNETKNTTNKDLGDGIQVSFTGEKFTKGDTFLIPCTAKVTESEFVYTIESKDFGEENNFISHKLEDGTELGTKKLTIYDGKRDQYEYFDNLGGAFTLKYKGEQPYAALTITPNGVGDAIKLQTFIGASEEEAIIDLDLNLDESQFNSVRKLALAIQQFDNYEVDVVATTNYDLTVKDLDFVTKKNIKEECPITAVLRDLKKTCTTQSGLVEVNIINREVSNYKNYEYTSLTGGKEGTSPSSFINYLDLLGQYDIDYIVPLTDDLGIIAECKEHVIDMSTRHSKERRLVCGIGTDLVAGQLLQNVKKLAHERVQYVACGFHDFNDKVYPAYITAAMHAGRAAFLGVESATSDIYKMLKPARTFNEQERNDLIDNGVLFFDEVVSEYDYKTFYSKLVWDYTTFSEYNDPLFVERSTRAIADQLSKEIRKALDKMLTGKLTPVAVLESAKNKVLSILKDNIKRGIILNYGEVKVSKTQDKTHIYVEIAPTQVNNFTFIDLVFNSEDIVL